MSSRPHVHPEQARPEQARRWSFVVEMFRDQQEPGPAELSCTLSDWDFLCELGKTFGWHPVGTTYLLRRGQRVQHVPIRRDYQPGDSKDRKSIEIKDCARWAAALETARRSPFVSSMVRAHVELQEPGSEGSEQALHLLLQSFIEFAGRGAFTVALKEDN
jgi:hypothetical protein